MKSCPRHLEHVASCPACLAADVRHDQHVQIVVLILVALAGWVAFRVTEPASIETFAQESRR